MLTAILRIPPIHVQISELMELAGEVVFGGVSRAKRLDFRRRVQSLLFRPVQPRTVFDCLTFRQPQVEMADERQSAVMVAARQFTNSKAPQPFTDSPVDTVVDPELVMASVIAEFERQSEYLASIISGYRADVPPDRFRKELVAQSVLAGIDPLGYLWEFLHRSSAEPRLEAPHSRDAPRRATRLSVPEKVSHLFHIVCGFFGTCKVDARNCP